MKNSLLCFLSLLSLSTLQSQDWNGVAVPASTTSGKVWKLDAEHSDSFNYADKNNTEFKGKWIDNHRGRWPGPGLTQFSSDHSYLRDGKLIINSGKVNNISGKRIFCGYVTTKQPIMFPVYTEVNMKVSASWLSSNYWLLSPDDVNEIDVTETYGKDDEKGRSMNTNYHIFQRQPFKDLTPQNGKEYKSEGNVQLKNGYHRFGVNWKSATEFDFYFDGKLVRQLNKNTDLKDPRNRFFDQPMHIIMNLEDHPWRVDLGKTPSDAELQDIKLTEMFVDWVRTYKPVNKGDENNPTPISDAISLQNTPKTYDNTNTFALDVNYQTSKDNMEVYVSLWKGGAWVNAKSEFVTSGKGTKKVTITLNENATAGDDYFFKYHIRPKGTDYKAATDLGETDKFTITNSTLSAIDFGKEYNLGFVNPIVDGILELKNVPVGTPILLYAISGQVILETKSDNGEFTNIDVSGISNASYILKIGDFTAKHLVIQN